jgi:hypothetical protein
MRGRLEIEVIDEKSINGIELTNKEREEFARELDAFQQQEYAQAVEDGRALAKAEGDVQWKLGDLATTVTTRYGDKTFKHYAADIGVKFKTLSNYRSTAVAWPKNSPRGEFSICRELNAVPERHKILEDNPELTNREAAKIARAWRKRKQCQEMEASASNATAALLWAEVEVRLARIDQLCKGIVDTIDDIDADSIAQLEVTEPQRKEIKSHIKRVEKACVRMVSWEFICGFLRNPHHVDLSESALISDQDRELLVRLEKNWQQREAKKKKEQKQPAAPKKPAPKKKAHASKKKQKEDA